MFSILFQIEDLPSAEFWKNMKNLRLLYLHDNPVSKLDSVHSLSFCPTLTALTLSNTPLSLKVAYRHIVVNSIFSLKALDYYIISDEEIMEDWRLPEKFRPFTPMFFVDYRPHSSKVSTFCNLVLSFSKTHKKVVDCHVGPLENKPKRTTFKSNEFFSMGLTPIYVCLRLELYHTCAYGEILLRILGSGAVAMAQLSGHILAQ